MDAEEGRKLYLMRDSVMAHPDARWLLEQEGTARPPSTGLTQRPRSCAGSAPTAT